jgi:hypothetical protein
MQFGVHIFMLPFSSLVCWTDVSEDAVAPRDGMLCY